MPRLKNSFWFNHAANNSKAVLIHADIYDLPEIGEFNVAAIGVGAPALSVPDENHLTMREALPVDPHHRALLSGTDRRCLRTASTQENEAWHTWWRFGPDFFTRYLGVIGFGDTRR